MLYSTNQTLPQDMVESTPCFQAFITTHAGSSCGWKPEQSRKIEKIKNQSKLSCLDVL